MAKRDKMKLTTFSETLAKHPIISHIKCRPTPLEPWEASKVAALAGRTHDIQLLYGAHDTLIANGVCVSSHARLINHAALTAAMREGDIEMCEFVFGLHTVMDLETIKPCDQCAGCTMVAYQGLTSGLYAHLLLAIGARTPFLSVMQWLATKLGKATHLPTDMTSEAITSPPTPPTRPGRTLGDVCHPKNGKEERWIPMRRFTDEERVATQHNIDWPCAFVLKIPFPVRVLPCPPDARKEQQAEIYTNRIHNRGIDLGHEWDEPSSWDRLLAPFMSAICDSPLRFGKRLLAQFFAAAVTDGIPLHLLKETVGRALAERLITQATTAWTDKMISRNDRIRPDPERFTWQLIKHAKTRTLHHGTHLYTGLFTQSIMKKYAFARTLCPELKEWVLTTPPPAAASSTPTTSHPYTPKQKQALRLLTSLTDTDLSMYWDLLVPAIK